MLVSCMQSYIIWDFDNNNLLKPWLRDVAPPGALSLNASIPGEHCCISRHMEALLPKAHNWPTYNPYPKLGAPFLLSWPCDLPLDDIKKPQIKVPTLLSHQSMWGAQTLPSSSR